MIRPRRLAAVLAAAAILGTGAAVAAHTGPTAGPHRVDLGLPIAPTAAPVLPADPCALGVDELEAAGLTEADALARRTPCHPGPLAALVADGAGSTENVRAAACMRDPAVLAVSGWTPEQLAQLPAVAAVECPTDHDPAPAAPHSSATPARRPAPSSSPAAVAAPPRTTPARAATAPEPAATARPTAAPAATTGPGHTPPCDTGTAWDGHTCAAPQGDAERIGRTVDTNDGRSCTLTAVDPDAWRCTRSQP